MDKSDYENLREASNKIMQGLWDLTTKHKNDDEFLYALKGYVDDIKEKGYDWNIDKVQIILAILKSKEPGEIREIISYIERTDFGWQGDTYKFYNTCIEYREHCRHNYHIGNTPEMTEQAFLDMEEIFLHKEYGAITSYLFGYCIASLFSSRLKEQQKSIPYFLQIACKRNSNVYRLVHEIVHICDVNTGLFENCDKYDYIECDHDHFTIYPSETGEKLFDTLTYYRDIPVIVDGYENEKLYEILIREVANIPRKNKRLDIKEKFNILPVFISPVLHAQFQNVFSIDLTELDIPEEYIELLCKNKQRLGSWTLELVAQAKEYFDAWNATPYVEKTAAERLIESRRPDVRTPLFYDLPAYIGRLRTKYNRWTKLTSKDVTNIGYLAYFFSYYMKVFKASIRLSEGTSFTYRGVQDKYSPAKLIEQIVDRVTESLFQFHGDYSPARPEIINIDINTSDKSEEKRIRKKGSIYAKDIVKYYQSYKVFIRISDIKYKDERYVFSVKLLPGTDAKLLSRYAEEIRRLLEVEIFMIDKASVEIKLVVAEKSLNENSLIKILESDQFKNSKMELPYAVGYDILGEMVIADIAKFPHLLVGGTTNSGKSSALHSLLMSIVYKQPASKVKLLLLDFGSSDLDIFDKVPHMLHPTIRANEVEKGRYFLLELQKEMERRLKKKDSLEKRKFDVEFRKWPSIICIIDEFQAFIRQLTIGRHNAKDYMIIEDILARARKVKIYLVLATQNASKGNIEIRNTNLGASIAFKCTNRYDSEAIIGSSDAVYLSGKGSMYFKCKGLKRIQGAYMSPDEIIDMVDKMNFTPNDEGEIYDEVRFESFSLLKSNINEQSSEAAADEESEEEKLCRIVKRALKEGNISNNMIKGEINAGYVVANRYLEQLEKAEIISKQRKGAKSKRIVNLDKAKEFLKDKGYSDEAKEGDFTKEKDIPGMQNEMNLTQEQSTGSTVEKSDIPEQVEDIEVNTSKQQRKRIKIQSPKKAKGITVDHDRTKRRPAH